MALVPRRMRKWHNTARINKADVAYCSSIMAVAEEKEASSEDELQSCWTQLLHELHKRILQHLPAVELFRYRTVCKDWELVCNEIIKSNSSVAFLIPADGYCGEYLVLNASGTKWDLCYFNVPMLDHTDIPSGKFRSWTHIEGVASDCGLVCLSLLNEKNGFDQSVVVLNPLTRKWVRLPTNLDFEGWRRDETKIQIDPRGTSFHLTIKVYPNTNEYEIRMVGVYLLSEGCIVICSKYDSKYQAWDWLFSGPNSATRVIGCIAYNDAFYAMLFQAENTSEPERFDLNGPASPVQGMKSYGKRYILRRYLFVAHDSDMLLPSLAHEVVIILNGALSDSINIVCAGALVVVKDRLFFVAGGNSDSGVDAFNKRFTEVYVFELNPVKQRYTLIGKMPRRFYDTLFSSSNDNPHGEGSSTGQCRDRQGNEYNDQFWGATAHNNSIMFHSKIGHPVVAFDVLDGTMQGTSERINGDQQWWNLPPVPGDMGSMCVTSVRFNAHTPPHGNPVDGGPYYWPEDPLGD